MNATLCRSQGIIRDEKREYRYESEKSKNSPMPVFSDKSGQLYVPYHAEMIPFFEDTKALAAFYKAKRDMHPKPDNE